MVIRDLKLGLLIIFQYVLYCWFNPELGVTTAKLAFSFEHFGDIKDDNDAVGLCRALPRWFKIIDAVV